jgi:hypothetical protein
MPAQAGMTGFSPRLLTHDFAASIVARTIKAKGEADEPA